MKRILSALIASVALFAAASGAAHAAAPAQCSGPASYCNVFFGN
ncbi:Spy/CpxP family protein refolding chaperone [Paraburkholderia sp. GAS199]